MKLNERNYEDFKGRVLADVEPRHVHDVNGMLAILRNAPNSIKVLKEINTNKAGIEYFVELVELSIQRINMVSRHKTSWSELYITEATVDAEKEDTEQ